MIIITKSKMNIRQLKTALLGTAILLLLGSLLYLPAAAVQSAKSALNVCASSLIPSLFPFAVLVSIINSSGILIRMSEVMGRPLGFIFGVNADTAYVLLIGALGGFPIGAICVRDLYTAGRITADDASRLVAFSSNASPAFCIAVLGISLFGDRVLGIRLYVCQLIPLLVIAFFSRPRHGKSHSIAVIPKRKSISDIITNAISDSGTTMLKICSFAVFFAVAGDILCSAVIKLWGIHSASVCAALFELTLAGRYAASLGGKSAAILAAFAVGWSGISVHMQTASVLSESGISLSFYRKVKLVQGIACAILMYAVT